MISIRLASIFLTSALAHAGTVYNITDLGTVGGTSAAAFGLSSNGLAAGAATTAFGYQHAFSSSGSGMTDLTLNTNAAEGMASAINGAGQVAGTGYINGQAYATVWTGGAGQTIAGAGSYALAINDGGQVAGMFTTAGQGHAFVMSDGLMVDLGDLPGGAWSAAYGINGSGEVAGYGDVGSGEFGAFTWTAGSGYTELGGLGGANSYAMAVNDAGVATGNAQLGTGFSHAVTWTDGTAQDLGTLGGNSSYGYGINDGGEVVGYSYVDNAGVTHAFLVENGVMIDLNNLIDPASGWTLTAAYAINGSGEIVGSGLLNGVEHAFRLDLAPVVVAEGSSSLGTSSVPEPSTWSLILIAGAMLIPWRLRLLRQQRDLRPAPLRSGAWLR